MDNPAPKPKFLTILAVALCGVGGSLARVYLPWPAISTSVTHADPVPTLVVNLMGAVLLGFVTGYTTQRKWPEALQKGLTVGFLGSFTTMSALALALSLIPHGSSSTGTDVTITTLGLGLGLVLALIAFLALTTVLTVASYRFGLRQAE